MPLIPGKSKKAFSKNVEIEMNAGKPQKQALAIAYSVKRKKKASGGSVSSGSKDMNYADGGEVENSARSESRPMPDKRYNDSKDVSQNSGKKPASQDSWTDRPDIRQSQKGPKTTPIKHPSFAQSPVFKVKMRDQEDDLQDSASVNEGPQHQPPQDDNEIGPDRQGPKVSDMQDEHSTHRKPYAKGGMIDDMDHPSKHDMQPDDSGIQEHEREDESHLESMEAPSEDEGASVAHADNEIDPDRHGDDVPDMEHEHSNGRKPYARGGEVSPEDEIEEERHNSIAAAIMARRDRMHDEIDSGAHDLDHAVKMAEGGEINGADSIYSDDSSQADLKRNAEEDANMEDQTSFNAMRKENYSESEGLAKLDQPRDSGQKGDPREDEEENKHDMISSIRSKMNAKRQFPK